jgi:hypothetical protein
MRHHLHVLTGQLRDLPWKPSSPASGVAIVAVLAIVALLSGGLWADQKVPSPRAIGVPHVGP